MIEVWDCPIRVLREAGVDSFFQAYWGLEKGLFKCDFYELPAEFVDACQLYERLKSEFDSAER
jgi:hypothetical protein